MMSKSHSRILLLMMPVLIFSWGCGGGGRYARPEDRVYTHRVERGQTLVDIADEYYGDPARSKTIETFNDLDGATLRPGMTVRVPMTGDDIANLQKREKAREPYNRGLTLAENGSYLDATQQFQAALTIDKRFVAAYYNLGVTYQKMKLYDRALEQFKQTVRLRPDIPKYHFGMGNSYFYLEQYGYAAEAFEKVVEGDPRHTKAQYSLAVSFEKLGKIEKARLAWQRYLEIDSDSAWAVEARRRLDDLR